MSDKYFVWRRNDGYISATCGYKPKGWAGTDGSIHTFEHLGEFDNWPDAYDLIAKLRREEAIKLNRMYTQHLPAT